MSIRQLYTVPLRPRSAQTVTVTRGYPRDVRRAVEALQREQAIPQIDFITTEGELAIIIFSQPQRGPEVFYQILDRTSELLGFSGR